MRSVKVGICVGTSCHLMGGMDLRHVLEDLKEQMQDELIIEYHTCLNHCRRGPNVLIDDELTMGITPENLRTTILERYQQGRTEEQ